MIEPILRFLVIIESSALLKIIEDWKKALDDNKFIAAILMDLSKDFDCLPHNLLLFEQKEIYHL
jgi:hypothetical protein